MFFAPNFGELFNENDPVNSLKKIATAKEKHARDCYPRVLEHIINTQSPQVLCRDYKEILGTLDIISTDPGKITVLNTNH
ncbi:AGAP006754-PA [Anopheles gambiae str. PEST]|uniref:AGAP006754-PA n=1 Tax=Anopheles gambiae TaxID=7165 RepID=A7US04_ANOGA|nr:AGAP006754-PA [Anopheles gambiae str. PEST]